MERKQIEEKDFTHDKQNTLSKEHDFCLNTLKNKLPLTAQNFASFENPQLIAITARQNLSINTFEIQIKKRKRAPNKKVSSMDIQSSKDKQSRDISTQTGIESNKVKGLSTIQHHKHAELFTAIDELPTTEYRQKLMRVFNEEFLAEHSKEVLGLIIDLVTKRDWLSLEKAIFYKIRRELSVTQTGCLLFDNRLVISSKLRRLVLQTIHSKHPGQAGMLALARLVWYPHIHSKKVAQA